MIRKIIYISIFSLLVQSGAANAGSTDSEDLKNANSKNTSSECFEGVSRAMFSLNYSLDKAIFQPVAKGYRTLPVPIRKGTGNAVNNLRSLLTFSNNILQADFNGAGNTAGRFVINTTVGVLGIFDPAAKVFGLKGKGKEDFGPTTVRDSVGLVGNIFLDPVYQITHNTKIDNGVIGNSTYSEHNYYYYRSTGAVDFRSKNIESFNSLEKNAIDLYATVKSLYLQERNKKIANSESLVNVQDSNDWEEIDTN